MLRKLAEALDNRHERKSLQRLTANFADALTYVAGSEDSMVQMWAAESARLIYRAFVTRYPNAENFANASPEERMAYLKGLSKHLLQIENEKQEEGVLTGAIMVNCWIAAVAWGAYQIADAMAEQLERQMQYPMERLTEESRLVRSLVHGR